MDDDNAQSLDTYREQYTFYAKKLLSDLGLGDLGQPERTELLSTIEQYVQQVIMNTLLENLDEPITTEAEKILNEGGTQEDALVYIMSAIPDIEYRITVALTESYARMVDEARQLADTLAANKPKQAAHAQATE